MPPSSSPMENDSTFVAPEGVYSVTEEHKPIPVTHTAPPPLYPTRLATVTVRFPASKQGPPGLGQLLGGGKDFWKDRAPAKEDGVSVSSSDTPDDNTTPDASNVQESLPQSPAVGADHHHPHHGLFTHHPHAHNNSKRKTASRPKHNMRTTSSTFITRLHGTEGLSKTLQSKQGDITYLFYNSAKNFYWMEAGIKAKEPLARISFSAYPTCHAVNQYTAAHDHLDIIIGFQTGDLIWFDPISLRYARLNKQGRISNSPCTAVHWVPSSPNLFLVSHADGSIVVYDKDREDGAFTPQTPTAPPVTPAPGAQGTTSEGQWNPLENIFVTMPPWHPVHAANGTNGKSEKDKAAKNPVSHWKVSKRSIVDFVFSPDVKQVAAISEDGCLRIIDALAEQLVDSFAAYFGALTCVAWSPDGRFIITGGQDDLVNIYSPWDQRVIARCQGHSSFVSALAFDDVRCDGRTYRFGSVGEDNKIILWDFSSGILHRPKLHASHQQRVSMSSTISLALRRRDGTADKSTLHLPPSGSERLGSKYHPAPSRNDVAVVQPVLVKQLDGDILTSITFLPRYLLTATKVGQIKLWVRPLVVMKNGHTPRTASSMTEAEDVG